MKKRILTFTQQPLGRAVLLFFYLFFVICAYVIGKAARDALFLERFKAVQLPYADIAIALLVGAVVAGYVRIGRKVELRKLISASLLVYSAFCGAFWLLALSAGKFPWLFPAIYVWVGIFGVLATAQAWTLANYILTTREAKQYFALVGSGAISGWIIGGGLTTLLARNFGTNSLLLAMGTILFACVVIVRLTPGPPKGELAVGGIPSSSRVALLDGLRQVFRHAHLRAIAAVIFLSSFVTLTAGWQFKAIAKQSFQQTDALTAFFGNFNFYGGLLALLAQFLLTSRMLKRFGIGPVLVILPLSLMLGSAAVLVFGTLAAAVFLKGSDQVLRYSLDKSSVELLYLPVPTSLKVQTKSFIDTFIWRLGDGFAGVMLLFATSVLKLTAITVSWVSLGFGMVWLGAALYARRTYVAALREGVRDFRLEAEGVTGKHLDRSAVGVLSDDLDHLSEEEIVYRLKMLEGDRTPVARPVIRKLVEHPSPAVRREAVALLAVAGEKGAISCVEKLMKDPDLEVRTQALVYLTLTTEVDPLSRLENVSHEDELPVRTSLIAYLAKAGKQQDTLAADSLLSQLVMDPEAANRAEAARLIGLLPPGRFERHLGYLLDDNDREVVLQAVCAVCKLRSRRFVPYLIEKLEDPELAHEVAVALEGFQDSIAGVLRDNLLDQNLDAAARAKLPAILANMATQPAVRILEEALLEDDPQVRHAVISSLNKLQQDHLELHYDTTLYQVALAAEAAEHYRSYRVLYELAGTVESSSTAEPRIEEMRTSMNGELERIFRILGLLYPKYDLESAHFGLVSDVQRVQDNAIELLENILSASMRSVLMPLLDQHFTDDRRAALSEQLFGAPEMGRRCLAVQMLKSNNAWLKACGAYAVAYLGIRDQAEALEECACSEDPNIRVAGEEARRKLVGREVAVGHD